MGELSGSEKINFRNSGGGRERGMRRQRKGSEVAVRKSTSEIQE